MTNRPLSPLRPSRKHLGASAAVLAISLGLPATAAGAAPIVDDENQVLALLNAERTARGMAPLRLEPTLEGGAAVHAEAMARANRIYHTNMTGTAPAGWSRLGENVGVGGDARQLHDMLMASPTHRAAMLDPAYDYVGIGVAHGSAASHFLSMKFADHPSATLGAATAAPGRYVSPDGRVSAIGTSFHGDLGGVRLAAPVVGITSTPSGAGYWLVSADGGVFSFGDAAFAGSAGALRLAAPIVGMTAMPDGSGYWLAAADGGVFAFGRAPFLGSLAGKALPGPVVRINRSASGAGYALYTSTGSRHGFGDAR